MSVLELRRANSPTEPDHSRGGLGWAGFGPNARAVFRCGRSVREMARQFLNPLFLKRSARNRTGKRPKTNSLARLGKNLRVTSQRVAPLSDG
jgi:hypothetical protein